MKTTLVCVGLLTTFWIAGCATSFNGSAPGPDGSLYVVGAREIALPFFAPQPAIWSCPSKPGQGDCTRMQVVERGVK